MFAKNCQIKSMSKENAPKLTKLYLSGFFQRKILPVKFLATPQHYYPRGPHISLSCMSHELSSCYKRGVGWSCFLATANHTRIFTSPGEYWPILDEIASWAHRNFWPSYKSITLGFPPSLPAKYDFSQCHTSQTKDAVIYHSSSHTGSLHES